MERKNTRTIALTSFLIIITSTIMPGYAYDWSPDMRLTWNINSDLMPSITQASDGKIWVLWHSYRTGNADIFYKIHDSSKVHPWSTETGLTTDAHNDVTPSIIQTNDGKIWVVWSTNRNGNYDIFYKVYDGVSWAPEDDLIMHPDADDNPSIMQASDGDIWVVWSTNRNGNYDIFYKTSSDNGATWSSDTPLPYPGVGDDLDPSIMQAANGEIWVVWVRNYDIFYKTSSDNGATWSPDYGLTVDPNLDLHPSIMQTSDGNIWVIWDSDRWYEQDDIYYKIYYSQSQTWSAIPTRLTHDLADDFMPSFMQATDQSIWVAWTSSRIENYDIYYKTTTIPDPHDVAIFSVIPSKAVVYQGQVVSIEVVAQNHGTNPETFDIATYADSIPVGSETISLTSGQLYPRTFPWNTSSAAIATYTVGASASSVTDETNTADNTFNDDTVRIKIPGDITGDDLVSIADAGILSHDVWSYPGHPKWNNGRADIDGDLAVNVVDAVLLSVNFGRSP